MVKDNLMKKDMGMVYANVGIGHVVIGEYTKKVEE
jgi:hypothetical protein